MNFSPQFLSEIAKLEMNQFQKRNQFHMRNKFLQRNQFLLKLFLLQKEAIPAKGSDSCKNHKNGQGTGITIFLESDLTQL